MHTFSTLMPARHSMVARIPTLTRRRNYVCLGAAIAISIAAGSHALAQDPAPGEQGWTEPAISSLSINRVGRSPFNPPSSTDTTFVVDDDIGLDTGCVFSSHGPLQV